MEGTEGGEGRLEGNVERRTGSCAFVSFEVQVPRTKACTISAVHSCRGLPSENLNKCVTPELSAWLLLLTLHRALKGETPGLTPNQD